MIKFSATLLATLIAASVNAATVDLRIMETTDLHSNMMDFDYYKDAATEKFGLVRTASLIEQARAEVKNSVLVDNGDVIQGSPLGDYMAAKGLKEGDVHPVYKAMNTLNYAVGNLGNHEFNYGLDFLHKALAGAKFPYVNANIIDAKTGKPMFTPYLIQDTRVVDSDGQIHTLRIGYIGFEQAWMDKLTTNAPHLKVFDTSKGIDVIHETGHNHGDHHHEGGIEPHIWNSARNASVIARNIYSALSELDSANEPYFKHRLDSLQQIIAQTDTDVRDRLQNADTTFLIYHPALSYFARDYGLKQISIEEGGKEPSPAHLKELIETCRRDNARVIFVQQEFDTRNARLIADELGVTVVPINPLSYEWREEMINVANALAK